MAAGKKKRSTEAARKRKPLPLEDYVARYGAPKRGHPRRDEYEDSPAFKKRSKAAKKGASKKAREELEELRRQDTQRRSLAAKRGAKTRKAKQRATLAYAAMMNLYAAGGGSASKWHKLRTEAHAAKWDLFEAVDEASDRYIEILEDIAEELDSDWHIAYGPGGD